MTTSLETFQIAIDEIKKLTEEKQELLEIIRKQEVSIQLLNEQMKDVKTTIPATNSKAGLYQLEAMMKESNKALKEHNLEAKRAWGSDGRSMGFEEDVDILLDNNIKAQCKIRKKLAKWVVPPESCDIAIVREDRGKTYVTIEYEAFLLYLKDLNRMQSYCEDYEAQLNKDN